MLNQLIQLLKDNALYLCKEIRQIKDSCCTNITTNVLDFDLVKEKFLTDAGIAKNALCSVDAVWLREKSNEIFLIEMKKYDNLGQLKIDDFVNSRVRKLYCKFVDSLLLLLGITGHYNIDSGFYSYFLNPEKLRVKSVFVINMSKKDYINAQLAILPYLKVSISRKIDGNIIFITPDMFYNTFK